MRSNQQLREEIKAMRYYPDRTYLTDEERRAIYERVKWRAWARGGA